ncbi:S-layer homology domain-containing protein [Phormidesmis priestleyi]
MSYIFQKTFLSGAILAGLSVGTIAAIAVPTSTPAIAASNTAFPDTQNYWAQPFIQSLAQRNIVSGYPDGTYRPQQAVDRDEFAAIIRDAFNQKKERQIASGSVYKDVPQGNWAVPAIESAYEMGFMSGYPGGYFRPQQPVTKVEAIASLARNLNLQGVTQSTPVVVVPNSTNQTPAAQANAAQPVRPQARRRRTMVIPMPMLALMQPFVNRPAPANAASTPSGTSPQTTQPTATAPLTTTQPAAQKSASDLLREYYVDADKIPQYAVNDVAAATRAGIVVNHPNLRVLNPNRPATRGEIAALIYQVLVSQGKATPIAEQTANQYVVGQR